MSEWQPIETAPKDGTEVLLWDEAVFLGSWTTWVDYWTRKPFAGFACDGLDDYNMPCTELLTATHWQPLPEPPHNDKREK